MVFSSATFIFVFMPIIMIAYLVTPKKFRNVTLFLSGLIFYAWGEFAHIYFIIITMIVDYFCGMMMKKSGNDRKKKKVFFLLPLIINFGLLGVFKYSSFVVTTINSIFKTSIPDPNMPLPVGISFYTFCSASYIIDVYLDKTSAETNFIDYGAYLTMFPKILMGPIAQYKQIFGDLKGRSITYDKISDGVVLFIRGLAKKVLLSETIGGLWITIKELHINDLSIGLAWMGIIAYAFNLYLDFSGYSDMARGLGLMLGFDLPINFNYPYMATSISDFWRRWHITLGAWFKEYIYIPLGGNRVGKPKLIRNLLIIWMLTGLWHGASWNFVVWGLYFGLLIVFERMFLGKYLEKLPVILRRVYSFLLVLLGWVMFDFTSIVDIVNFFGAMFGVNKKGVFDTMFWYYLGSYAIIFIICAICSTDLIRRFGKWLKESYSLIYNIVEPVAYIAMFLVSISYLVEATNSPFLYFKF